MSGYHIWHFTWTPDLSSHSLQGGRLIAEDDTYSIPFYGPIPGNSSLQAIKVPHEASPKLCYLQSCAIELCQSRTAMALSCHNCSSRQIMKTSA